MTETAPPAAKDLEQLEPETGWGPCMAKLSPRRRLFVAALFDAPLHKGGSTTKGEQRGRGQLSWAIRTAGYTGGDKGLRVYATRLLQDTRVADAVREEAHRRFRLLPMSAIPALERLIGDPEHKDHAKALGMWLERFAPVQSSHTLTIQDNRPATEEAIERVMEKIVHLAARVGIAALPPAVMIDAEVIDAEVVEVSPE